MINPILLEKVGAEGKVWVFGLACKDMCACVYMCVCLCIYMYIHVCMSIKGENTMGKGEYRCKAEL